MRLIKDGASTDLASYPQTLSADTDYGVLVQVRDGWIRVKIDEVTRMTVRETTLKAAGRVGLWGFGIPRSSPTAGMHLDKFLLASPGYAPPHYDLTGPSTGTPGVASADYTVALERGANPGAVTITPTASGLAGAFSPGAVTLTDAARSGTFTFTPAGIGTGTISVSDGGRLRDPPGVSFTSAFGPPARLAYFESQIPWPCRTGPAATPPAPDTGWTGPSTTTRSSASTTPATTANARASPRPTGRPRSPPRSSATAIARSSRTEAWPAGTPMRRGVRGITWRLDRGNRSRR